MKLDNFVATKKSENPVVREINQIPVVGSNNVQVANSNMVSNNVQVANNNMVSNNVQFASDNFAAFQFNPSYIQQQPMVGFIFYKVF